MTFAIAADRHPRIREWQHLTGSDFKDVDPEKTVVMLSCSPLEVHGPHLPVITDNIEAEGLAFRAMELLCDRFEDIQFLHMPPVWVAADVLPHRGSVMFKPSTIVRVLEDLGRSLAKQGYRHIWISNFHGGPRHFVPIEVACRNTNRRYGTQMVSAFSLLIKRLTNGGTDLSAVLGHIAGLSAEELEGDSHGGAIETSMMLHLIGDHVDGGYTDLERTTVSSKLEREGQAPLSQENLSALMRGFKVKLKYYEDETYAGKPSIASPEIGRQIIEELGQRTADALAELWTGELDASECHSPVWPMRWLFMNRTANALFERAVQYKQRVF